MIGFCECRGEQQALDVCVRDLGMHIGVSNACKNHTRRPPMNVGSASIDAENATTHNPRGFSGFLIPITEERSMEYS